VQITWVHIWKFFWCILSSTDNPWLCNMHWAVWWRYFISLDCNQNQQTIHAMHSAVYSGGYLSLWIVVNQQTIHWAKQFHINLYKINYIIKNKNREYKNPVNIIRLIEIVICKDWSLKFIFPSSHRSILKNKFLINILPEEKK